MANLTGPTVYLFFLIDTCLILLSGFSYSKSLIDPSPLLDESEFSELLEIVSKGGVVTPFTRVS